MLRDQPFMRDDTFLGVCQTIGDGLRIPSNLLRLAIAPVMVFNPVTTLAVYTAAGVIIAILHLIIPAPAAAKAVSAEQVSDAASPALASSTPEVAEEPMLPLAEAA